YSILQFLKGLSINHLNSGSHGIGSCLCFFFRSQNETLIHCGAFVPYKPRMAIVIAKLADALHVPRALFDFREQARLQMIEPGRCQNHFDPRTSASMRKPDGLAMTLALSFGEALEDNIKEEFEGCGSSD